MEETRTRIEKITRKGWSRGPWDNEPDRIEWRDARAVPVLPCLIVRGPSGALCGYVAVPPGHPWHGKDHVDADVHGSITYTEKCQAGGHICHVPQLGESDDVWWVGFDCAHSGDGQPGRDADYRKIYADMLASEDPEVRSRAWTFAERPGFGIFGEEPVYRDERYVRRQVEKLADQAREVCK